MIKGWLCSLLKNFLMWMVQSLKWCLFLCLEIQMPLGTFYKLLVPFKTTLPKLNSLFPFIPAPTFNHYFLVHSLFLPVTSPNTQLPKLGYPWLIITLNPLHLISDKVLWISSLKSFFFLILHQPQVTILFKAFYHLLIERFSIILFFLLLVHFPLIHQGRINCFIFYAPMALFLFRYLCRKYIHMKQYTFLKVRIF